MTDNAAGARPGAAHTRSVSSRVGLLPAGRERIVVAGALLLVLAAALAVRLWGLTDRTMTHIEVYVPGIPLPPDLSIPLPRLTLRATLTGLLGDAEPHPPAYYLLMLVWTKLFGSSLLALRLPSVLFGVASVLLLYTFGIQLKERSAALLAAAMLALNGHQILWSQLAKGYIMACFLGLLATVLLVRLTRKAGRQHGLQLLYAGAVLAGLTTSHWFWALFATHILWILRCQWRNKTVPGLIRLQAAILVLGTPLLSLALFQNRRGSYLDSNLLRGLAEFLQFGYLFEADEFSVPSIAPPAAVSGVLLAAALLLLGAGLQSGRAHGGAKTLSGGPSRSAQLKHTWLVMAVGGILACLFILRMARFMSYFDPARTRLVVASSVLPLLAVAGALILERNWGRLRTRVMSWTQRFAWLRVPKPLDSPGAFLALLPAAMTATISAVVPLFASRGVILFTPYLVFVLAQGVISVIHHSKFWLSLALVLAVIHPSSVLYYRNTRHERPTEYKGLAEQWIPQIEESDLVFVQQHWATTPIFYYLDAEKYHVYGGDYAAETRRHPDSRVWALSFEGLPITEEMEGALQDYSIQNTIRDQGIAAALYTKASVGELPAPPDGAAEAPASLATEPYRLSFSTYLGGSGWEYARDMFVDAAGNVYVTGGTQSPNFPTTPGAYDRTFDATCGACGSDGPLDAFVTKFDASGTLVWSTYLGGPNYDRAYGIEVDSAGYVYLAGRAGPGFPTTAGSFQPDFQGSNQGLYGYQNAFVAVLAPDGSDLVWSSYVGVGWMCRDIAIDESGDIYVPLNYRGVGPKPPAAWFVNAFQATPRGSLEAGVAKIAHDGSRVIWATWLGGSGKDDGAQSIRVDADGYVYSASHTYSTDIPTTEGAYDRTYNGAADFYVAKLAPDGSDLVFGTYLGGSNEEWMNTHDLALDEQGNVYVSPVTLSTDYPTTPGALQRTFAGGSGQWPSDMAITKLSPTGALVASTYLGGSDQDNPDGLYVDASGNVFVTGQTASPDFPVTSDAYQPAKGGGHAAVILRLAADFSSLLYSTYLGGESNDEGWAGFLGSDGSLHMAGMTDGTGWPAANAIQPTYNGGSLDVIMAKLAPAPTVTPPTNVAISVSGPITGDVDVAYAFVASVDPATANLPVTYDWQATDQLPVTHVGGVSDTVSFAWAAAGAKRVTVTATIAAEAVSGSHSIDIILHRALYLPLMTATWERQP